METLRNILRSQKYPAIYKTLTAKRTGKRENVREREAESEKNGKKNIVGALRSGENEFSPYFYKKNMRRRVKYFVFLLKIL